MWLFTPIGFFSAVQKTGTTHLTIRARVESDLVSLRNQYLSESSEIESKGGTDYPYRLTVSHAAVSEALAKMGRDTGYGNFKDEVANRQGPERAHVYSKVWSTLLGLEKPSSKPTKHSPKALAYGGVLINGSGNVLLVEPKGHFDGYVWTFPKGRPNKGESAQDAAMREVKEETGQLGLIVGQIPGSFAGGTTLNRYFLMRPGMWSTLPSSDETASIQWASYSEARSLIRKTLNPVGMKRDLAVLDAAYLLWHRSIVDERHRFESREPTSRKSWKVVPIDSEIASMRFEQSYSEGEMDLIRRGYLPERMEEKWFLFFEDDCLYACRSWTGITIFMASFSKHAASKWSIDTVQMPSGALTEMGSEQAKETLQFLIDRLLLGRSSTLPMDSETDPEAAAVKAWHEVGKAILK